MMIRSNLSTPQVNSRSAAPQQAQPAAEQAAPQDSASIGEHKPGELLIRTRPGFALSGSEGSVVNQLGAKVVGEFDTPGSIHKSETGEFLHVKLPEGVSVQQAMAQLADNPQVEFAAPNNIHTLSEFETSQNPTATNDPDEANFGA